MTVHKATQKPASKAKIGLLAVVLATPMVMFYEGVVLKTYTDPVGIPTACIGETNSEVVMRDEFSRDECVALLGASLAEHAQGVSACVHRPLASHEAAAVLSWTFNIGVGAACSSTLMKKLNAGAPSSEWCPELKRWDKAGGKVLKGLTKRREAEYRMCMTGKWTV